MRISFLGDIMFNAQQLVAHKKTGNYDFSALVNSLKDVFHESDYMIANLETPVAGEEFQYTHEMYSFNTPVQILDALKEIGVDMVQTANNHCLDRGVEGLKKTIQNVEKAGLAYIGTHLHKEDSFKIINVNGIKVGILAFTYGTNAFANNCYLNESNKYCVDLLQKQELYGFLERHLYLSRRKSMHVLKLIFGKICPDKYATPIYERREPSRDEKKRLKEQLKKCKNEGAEYIVMLLHIGGQYNSGPSPYTKEMSFYCINNGANLVIANHEHVIHPYEKTNISSANFCWYSLGNFLSSTGVLQGPFDKLSQYSVVVHVDVDRNIEGISAKYSFQLFLSRQNEDGVVVAEPVINYLNRCHDNEIRKQVNAECSLLLNRIYHTSNKKYDICENYQVM